MTCLKSGEQINSSLKKLDKPLSFSHVSVSLKEKLQMSQSIGQ